MNAVERPARAAAAAFTLLEILAVVAIFALLATFVVPNFPALRSRALRQQAERVVARLELARQRAVVTGTPHQLVIDLDSGTYGLEWLASEADANPDALPVEPDAALDGVQAPLSLSAPPEESREFRPIPGLFGRRERLAEGFGFGGVETPEGWIEGGETFVAFERDGTATYTTIVLDDEDGGSLEIEVLPLADAVRIRDETS